MFGQDEVRRPTKCGNAGNDAFVSFVPGLKLDLESSWNCSIISKSSSQVSTYAGNTKPQGIC